MKKWFAVVFTPVNHQPGIITRLNKNDEIALWVKKRLLHQQT
jgi:hypothetical protein